ncbi:MAG: hypothetical protein ABSD71_01885 [Bacteroidales bacterium]|jgi:hypothetical protein
MNEVKTQLAAETCPDEKLIYQNNRELFYFYDKEKNCYTWKVAYQCETNQVIIKQGWDALEERIDEIKEQVIAGRLSPLAYYMEKSQMDVPILSQYSGIRKWRVKKHIISKGFMKLSDDDLDKYSKALNISFEELKNPEFLSLTAPVERKETDD